MEGACDQCVSGGGEGGAFWRKIERVSEKGERQIEEADWGKGRTGQSISRTMVSSRDEYRWGS